MSRATGFFLTSILITTLVFFSRLGIITVKADQDGPRQTTLTVNYTEYEWWLLNWADNALQCRIFIDHEGMPTADEVRLKCGANLALTWQSTPSCEAATNPDIDNSSCSGVYLWLSSNRPAQKQVTIDLPPINVYLTLDSCTSSTPDNLCNDLPSMLFTAEEPLPNQKIIAINGIYDGQLFLCQSTTCSVPLRATPVDGASVEFWADSSYGDSSKHFTATVRVVDSGVSQTPSGSGWYVDILSSQWRGKPLPTCADTWQSFPPIGGMPNWLTTPDDPQLLASDQAYYYLAGRLISQNAIDASECPSGGMLPNGYANACGLEKARPLVEEWQNQFDTSLIQVAKQTGVPAQLLKNLFAQESQFWPGIYKTPWELGLGQLTDNGADTILLWDNAFYDQFCPLVFAEETCQLGYLHLAPQQQATLRGALALQAKADCTDCTDGVNLNSVDFSLTLFANTVKASCDQVAQIVYNATSDQPGNVCSYEDLWRLTIANYHAGAGCVSYAVHTAWNAGGTMDWQQVSVNFTDACKGVIPYVDKITR